MFQTKLIHCAVLASAACLAAAQARLNAAQISGLVPTDVIYTSGDYNATFVAKNVLDTQTGPVFENNQNANPPSTSGFWLAPDGAKVPDYFVIDLTKQYELTSVDLFNTHNAQFNDRGTGQFLITGSNNLADLEAQPVSLGTTITSGTLMAANSGTDPLVDQHFIATTGNQVFQYIRFDAVTGSASGTLFTANAVGLNEIRLNGGLAPEPGSFILGGLGAIGLFWTARRRRRA
jgi:hypothetical protein